MTSKATTYREADVYSGFDPLSRSLLKAWKEYVIEFDEANSVRVKMGDLNRRLEAGNVIIFFDHHYAFDAVPLGLALGKYIETLQGLLIPYAVHLDMGVGREGEFSLRYKFRTYAFHWLVNSITRNKPSIQFLPVVREFEQDTPRLRKIVEQDFQGVNTKYLRTFIREFSEKDAGQVCFLTPFSGIAFPGKAVLHPQLYRSIKMVCGKCQQDIPFYMVGAYPNWRAFQRYYAPLTTKHKIVMRGPFFLPIKNYEASKAAIRTELHQLRADADFTPPDYDRILTK